MVVVVRAEPTWLITLLPPELAVPREEMDTLRRWVKKAWPGPPSLALSATLQGVGLLRQLSGPGVLSAV